MIKFGEKTKRGSEVLQIPVNSIRPNPYQPRRTFRWEDLEELAQSIYENGLLQPITVRAIANGEYELVAGERRLRAAKMAGMAEIPSIVVEVTEEASAVYAVIENLQRRDLHFFEEAHAIARLSKEFGMDREQLARRLGKSPSAVSNKLRLLNLPEDIRAKIVNYGLTERHARAILRLPAYQLMQEVVEAVAAHGLNVAATEALVEQLLTESAAPQAQEKQKPKEVKIFKDVKLFLNTLDHAVLTMRKNGIHADSFQKETDGYVEYVVRIHKA